MLLIVVLALAGCAHGRGVPLTGSSLIPAATGKITLKDRDKVNKTVHIRVAHLAQPQTLPREALAEDTGQAAAQAYVVWLQPMGSSSADNLGVLIPNQNLEAELTTSTTQSRFDIFVTAEPSAMQTMPTGRRLLQASVQ